MWTSDQDRSCNNLSDSSFLNLDIFCFLSFLLCHTKGISGLSSLALMDIIFDRFSNKRPTKPPLWAQFSSLLKVLFVYSEAGVPLVKTCFRGCWESLGTDLCWGSVQTAVNWRGCRPLLIWPRGSTFTSIPSTPFPPCSLAFVPVFLSAALFLGI